MIVTVKWIKTDLERYIGAKEYIDTLLVPLLPFQFSSDSHLGKNAFQMEVLSVFLNELEKELTGRLLLTPAYHYLKTASKSEEIERISTWIKEAKQQPFEHVFYVTFDGSWKKTEQELDGTLLWLPVPQSGDIHSGEIGVMIRDQVEQVGELIRSYW